MVARRCSETYVYFYHTTQCHFSGDCLLLVDLMPVTTNLDVRGFTVTKYDYLLLGVTREIARDGFGQVQSSDKKTAAGSCRFSSRY